MIDALATAPHYVDHLAAVLRELPPEARGSLVTPSPPSAARGVELGIRRTKSNPTVPVLVASHGDLVRAQAMGYKRIAIMEHGAGQSYGGRASSSKRGSYAGGSNRGAASLFLHPGPHPAARDRAAYPASRVEVVGAPHLDTLPGREGQPGRVVAYSCHFNGALNQETRNAWPWIFPQLVYLKERFDLIGHAHPRVYPAVVKWYRKYGIEPVADFSDVCRRADVYVCDNSSTLFAFAATGRPVVVLNPPWYDRRVNHGLRFWEAAGVGVNCDDPATLGDCIEEALRDTPAQKAKREEALGMVYAYRTGAGKRAADVLQDWAA